MSSGDAQRWDDRYTALAAASEPGPPSAFSHLADRFPTEGAALELACGTGQASVWLAQRGMIVTGLDVSPVAIERAVALAAESGVANRCSFLAHDLDQGLPQDGSLMGLDLVLCHMFRDPALDAELVDRLAPGGLLAIAVLSEVGAQPGRFRARPGELRDSFGDLDVLDAGERDGRAWLLGRLLA